MQFYIFDFYIGVKKWQQWGMNWPFNWGALKQYHLDLLLRLPSESPLESLYKEDCWQLYCAFLLSQFGTQFCCHHYCGLYPELFDCLCFLVARISSWRPVFRWWQYWLTDYLDDKDDDSDDVDVGCNDDESDFDGAKCWWQCWCVKDLRLTSLSLKERTGWERTSSSFRSSSETIRDLTNDPIWDLIRSYIWSEIWQDWTKPFQRD